MIAEGSLMVELPIGHARLLIRAMSVVVAEDTTRTPICQELLDSLERAIGLAEVRNIRGQLRHRRPRPEPVPPLRPRPRWDHVARAIRAIEAMVYDDPAALARTDALGAYVRDTFDALGLSVTDEDTLYVAITTVGILVEMADNGRKNGAVDGEIVRAIAEISQTFTAALINYLPPEARR